MNDSRNKIKSKELKKDIESRDAVNSYIQPFKEMPSVTGTGKGSEDRINAHDLFSLYTADIIKEDIIFSR